MPKSTSVAKINATWGDIAVVLAMGIGAAMFGAILFARTIAQNYDRINEQAETIQQLEQRIQVLKGDTDAED